MNEHLLLSLAAVVGFGIAAQWLAWRLHFPSILLLLVFGVFAGSVVDPDELFGETLFPLVSLFVGVILFEGGLSLRLAELRDVGRPVRNLISIGLVVTWLATAAAATFILDLDLGLALLFGAILTVTGPTVVGPLLRQVRPNGRVGSILKWEGIVNDPIGAMLSVLVLEAIVIQFEQATLMVLFGIVKTVFFGVGIGLVSAVILVFFLRRYWIPDFLHSPVALGLAVMAFGASNTLQHESGLLAVTVMGVFFINQKGVNIKHIVEFKENLRVLLISILFILLGARLDLEDLRQEMSNPLSTLGFLAVLMLVIRPLCVFASTVRTELSFRERVFISWMAPRGVVAAAVASVFALRLGMDGAGIDDVERLVPLMFLVIIATVTIYGLTAAPLARWLKLADSNPQGVLIVGAHKWARTFAKSLQEEGFRVLLVDTNWEHISAARMTGLPTFYGSVLSEYTMDELDLEGIGRLVSLTPNDEVNSLACLHFADIFGRAQVFQLFPTEEDTPRKSPSQRGRLLFGPGVTHDVLEDRFDAGEIVKKTTLTDEFDMESFQEMYGGQFLPLCLVTESRELLIYTKDKTHDPKPGQTLIALVQDVEKVEEPAHEEPAQ